MTGSSPAQNASVLRTGYLLIWAGLLGVFLFATFRATLVGVSDWYFRIGTEPAIERAMRFMPSNARYHYHDALAIEQNHPASGVIAQQFAEAVRLNPRFSDAMLSWSVEKELTGDRKGAENLLIQAKAIDHLLRPPWAMANFYYRTGDADRFWPQARECLRLMAHTGVMEGRFALVPVFNLCWSVSQDANTIFTKAIPEDRIIRDYYLGYLLNSNRIDAAKQVAATLYSAAEPSDGTFLVAFCNALIARADIQPALAAWNGMAARRVIPFQPLDLPSNRLVTDPSFAFPPTGNGFDWRALYPDQAHFTFSDGSPGYHFSFDGSEPESFKLLSQITPVSPDVLYHVEISARSSFDALASGLRWAAVSLSGAPLQISDSPDGFRFRAPQTGGAVQLVLSYERQPGTTVMKGNYDLHRVTVTQDQRSK